MWPPGHLAVGYLFAAGWSHWDRGAPPGDLTVRCCVLASLLPDLVDKSLAWGLGILPGGRTLLHSLLFVLPLSVLFAVFARRSGQLELGLLIGWSALSHPLLDALPALWDQTSSARHLLWPLLAVETVERSPPGTATVQELLLTRLTMPWFLLELLLFVGAVVWWYRDGFPGMPGRRSVSAE